MTPQSEVAPYVFPLALAFAIVVGIPISFILLHLYFHLLAYINEHTDWLDYDDVGPC